MKILFPTDFSEAADHAFIYALKVADKLGAAITTLHVYDLPHVKGVHLPNTLGNVYESITLESFENFKDNIPHLRDIAEENNLGHVVCKHSMTRMNKSGTVQTIVSAADKLEADFIVMGTTGASGLKEVFLGSVAAEVIENANRPVLAIPYKAQFDGAIDKVAYATDYKDTEHETLNSASELAKWFEAKLYVVHIDVSHTESYKDRMKEFMDKGRKYDNMETVVIDGTSVEESLANFIEEESIDLLAMRVKKRNFIEEFFTYSMTKKMANHLTVPVLGLHS